MNAQHAEPAEQQGEPGPKQHSEQGGRRATFAALTANLVIAVTKFVAWALTGASSMLSEAIHSLADTGNQVLLLLGGRTARRRPTPQHPLGFARQRYINGFLVSVILFSVGGCFALFEAWSKFGEIRAGHPDELLESAWWWVPLVVIGISLVAEGLSLRTALVESHQARGEHTLTWFIRHAKAPELPVVLLEDSAALFGLLFALLGIGLTLLTRNAIFDVVGSGAIGLLLIAVAVVLGIEMSSLLLGESAEPDVRGAIEAALAATPGVRGIIHLTALQAGPDQVTVAAKIDVSPEQSAQQIAAVIDAAETRIRAAAPLVDQIFLEPDIRRPDYLPRAQRTS